MGTNKRVPRQGRQIDVDRMRAEIDWEDPMATERVVLFREPPDAQNLLVEVNLDPELAVLRWDAGNTLLHSAAAYNERPLAQELLRHGADVNAKQEASGTPLHLAAQYDHTDMVRLLLQHKATANTLDGVGRAPLHYAALRNNTEVLGMLLDCGGFTNDRDKFGLTPLDLAASNCFPVATRMLVQRGAISRRKRTNSYLAEQGFVKKP